MEIGEYFMVRLPVWSTNFFQKKSNLIFSVDMGRGGVGVRVWVRVRVINSIQSGS